MSGRRVHDGVVALRRHPADAPPDVIFFYGRLHRESLVPLRKSRAEGNAGKVVIVLR